MDAATRHEPAMTHLMSHHDPSWFIPTFMARAYSILAYQKQWPIPANSNGLRGLKHHRTSPCIIMGRGSWRARQRESRRR